MLASLTRREARVVEHLERQLRRLKVPSVEELARAAGLSSRGYGITSILDSLEDKSYITRERGKKRSLRLLNCGDGQPFNPETIRVPLAGQIAAGEPVPVPSGDYQPFAGEMVELTLNIMGGHEDVYALRVKGESMIDRMIVDGDIVIMRHQRSIDNGELAAVRIKDDEGTTLKFWHRDGDRVRLEPANSAMAPLYYHSSEVEVQGKVLTVIRQLA